jgi:lipoprotein-anchoring transpeptidase ErfK/SrfK
MKNKIWSGLFAGVIICSAAVGITFIGARFSPGKVNDSKAPSVPALESTDPAGTPGRSNVPPTIPDAQTDLFSKLAASRDVVTYEVKPADTLNRIASRFGTTVELIVKSNRLKSTRILPEMKIKVFTGKLSVLIDRSDNTLAVLSGENVFKVYSVSTGENNSTPLGTFTIVNKLVNPVWYKAGAVIPSNSPKNALGSRWLGISRKGYGIHGTRDPGGIGKHCTAGCIRMLNQDVEEVFSILPPGTEVKIVE